MKNRRILIFIATALSLLGCNQPDLKLVPKNSVVYELGYAARAQPCVFDEDGKRYVGFGNLEATYLVSIFTEKGELVSVTDIYPAMERENCYAESYQCLSKDTIAILYNRCGDWLGLINSKGDSIRTYKFDDLGSNGLALQRQFEHKDGKYWFEIGYSFWDLPEEEQPVYYSQYFRLVNHSPRLMMASGKDLENREYLMSALTSRFAQDTHDVYEERVIEWVDDKLLCCSQYCDTIYEFDTHGKLLRMVKIPSRTGKLSKKEKVHYRTSNEEWNEHTITDPMVADLLYDKYREVYYCIVKDTMYSHDFFDSTLFHIVIYDKELNQRGYVSFNDFKHLPWCAFVGKKGLYIRQNSRDLYYRSRYTIFKCRRDYF